MLDNIKLAKNDDGFSDEYTRMYPGENMPRSVTFIVTESCNLRCTYCYEHNKSQRDMSIDTAKKCIDLLFKMDAENHQYINPEEAPALILDFIGGEPMLKIDLIDQIMDYFLRRAVELNHRWAIQYMISMSSNGTLYFDERVQRFLRKHEGRVSVGITIDGDKKLHDACRLFEDGSGSYDIAAKAFRDIIEKHGLKGTKLTIAPGNIDYLATAVKHMYEDFDISVLHANCVFEEGWTNEHAKVLYGQMKVIADWLLEDKRYERLNFSMFDHELFRPLDPDDNQNWCGGTGKMLAFGVDGKVYPCLRYAPLSIGEKQKPLVIGTCDTGIEVTPEQCQICSELRAITRRSQSTDECFNCPIGKGCAWCSAYNYEVFGTPNKRATFICCMHKARALANVYMWNKLARQLGLDERFPMYVPEEWAVPIIGKDEYEYLRALSAEGGADAEV